jgi:hypothetical protein
MNYEIMAEEKGIDFSVSALSCFVQQEQTFS